MLLKVNCSITVAYGCTHSSEYQESPNKRVYPQLAQVLQWFFFFHFLVMYFNINNVTFLTIRKRVFGTFVSKKTGIFKDKW